MKTLQTREWLFGAVLIVLLAFGCSSPLADGTATLGHINQARAFSQSWDDAYFRGTANGWSATPMDLIGDNFWSITQDFSGQANPRFKIDRFGNWAENYPTGDVLVGAGEWVIVFNDLSKAVTAMPKGDAQFSTLYFRGTANGWASTPMTQVSDYIWETTQDFSGQANPRFKLDRFGDWSESFPATDFLITEPGSKTIQFDSRTRAVTLVESTVPVTGAPSLSPTGGTYSDQVSVTANGEGVIYYTTDGTTPDEGSQVFPDGGIDFTDQGDIVLKVRALAPGKTWSGLVAEQYTITGPVTPLTVYVKASSTPIIWAWEVNGRNISELEGYSWGDQESMISDGGGWYKWSVPPAYLPLSGDLGFKINQSNPEHLVSQTSWNETPINAGSWVTVDPRVPSAPSISLSPSVSTVGLGSSKTISVVIQDNGSGVTNQTYSIDGVQRTLSGSSITINAGTKPDGTKINLIVSATNANGTSVTTGTYTVKDFSGSSWRDFREENVYFMMTDRFADGNTSNNNLWGDEYLPGGESQKYAYDESKTGLLTYYHGGDFQGIINNLDYLQDMGFTAIWITPAVKQPEGRYYYDGSAGGDYYEASAFHGYWAYDFDQIDPHLHDSGVDNDGWSDFEDLADELHARDMKLMLDIVVNHGHPGTVAAPTQWADVADTVIMDGQTFSYANDPYKDVDDVTKGFYNYIGGYDIAGLVDFNERGPDGHDAREHLKNVYKRFIDAGVDAFRIDTVAYMTDEWWGEFADAMHEYAQSKGNDYFYMVGESWTGRGTAIQRHSKDTSDSFHMLDMQASTMDYPGQMHNAFKNGGDYAIFANLTSNDPNEGLSDEGATWTGMFVDNHDVFRSNGIFSETQYKNALTYIYLFRGIPIVYYGTEAMYSWPGAHASTNKDDIVARWMLGQQGINHVKNNQPGDVSAH
jgi:glycosidase